MKLKIGIVSAEPSGDLLGAELIESLSEKFDTVEVVGVGSGPLKKYSVEKDRKELEIMGLIDPILNYSKIKAYQSRLIKKFISNDIDLFIGIDSPDFNIGIHKALKMKGIPTAHVVCPSVWAWRSGRISQFKHIDYMLYLFDFEKKYAAKVNKASFCVGHPLVRQSESFQDNKTENLICLLPGSRTSEIKSNVGIMIDSFKSFNNNKKYQAVIPCYSNENKKLVEKYIKDEKNIKATMESSMESLSKSVAAVVCSGTATLEAMLLEVPSVIVYRTNFLNFFLLRIFVKTKFIGLPNIISGKEIFKEFIQTDFSSKNIQKELNNLIANRTKILKSLKESKNKISLPNFNSFTEKFYDDCRSR